MGITPITNLMPLPSTLSIERELEPLPMERVENSARTGDETYSPSDGRSARGGEDDEPEDELEELTVEAEAEPAAAPASRDRSRPISLFA
jgi:hypothetical protein